MLPGPAIEYLTQPQIKDIVSLIDVSSRRGADMAHEAPAAVGTRPDQQVMIRTFLIVDIRGYTRFTVEQGDEAAARLAARFAEIVEQVVAERDGEVVEVRGDEALVVF